MQELGLGSPILWGSRDTAAAKRFPRLRIVVAGRPLQVEIGCTRAAYFPKITLQVWRTRATSIHMDRVTPVNIPLLVEYGIDPLP